MAIKKIKFPFLSTREIIKEARGGETVIGREDVNRGRFMAVWDKEEPGDDCPLLRPLYSMTLEPHDKIKFTVLTELGYQMTFNHAVVVDECSLPYVVCRKGKESTFCVGRLIGCSKDDAGKWNCCVAPIGSAPVCFCNAEDVVYLDDLKFGITEEEADGNN